MTTALDLVEETRRHLMSGQRDNLNQLLNDVNDTATTLNFTYDLNQVQAGAYVAVDLEIVYVWEVNTSGKTATVQRAMLGTTAAAHTAPVLTYANPRFPTFSIFQAINNDLDDLCSPTNGLFAVATTDITYDAAVGGYNLDVTSLDSILRVTAKFPGSREWDTVTKFQLSRNADTADFASGYSLELFGAGVPGYDVRVTYSKPFTHFAALTDNVTVSGLPATAYDLPPLGAAMRLTGVREVARNAFDAMPDSRRADEVRTSAQMQAMQAVTILRHQRVRAEADRLLSDYPPRRRV
jgi:hypothetical protein